MVPWVSKQSTSTMKQDATDDNFIILVPNTFFTLMGSYHRVVSMMSIQQYKQIFIVQHEDSCVKNYVKHDNFKLDITADGIISL